MPPDAGAPPDVATRAGPTRFAGLLPPVGRREERRVTLHGETLEDEYGWVAQKGSPEVEALLAAENAYTDAALAPLASLEARLDEEFDRRRPARLDEPPVRHGRYEYWRRHDRDRDFERYLRRPVGGGPEALVLDVGALAPGASYVDLLDLDVTDDGALVAWAVDTRGDRTFTLQVSDLRTGRRLPDRIERVTSFAWAADGRTLFYVTDDAARRPATLWRRVLGSGPGGAVLVHHEADAHAELDVVRSRCGRFLLARAESLTTSRVLLVDARRPASAPVVLVERKEGVRASVDLRGDDVFVMDDAEGPDQRIVSRSLSNPGLPPREWVPHRPGRPVASFEVLDRYLVVWERVGGRARPRAIELATGASRDFAAADGFLSAAENPRLDTTRYRYLEASPVQPPRLLERDLETGRTRTVWEQPVPGFDPGRYELLSLAATAGDGTAVPLTLARRKGVTGPGPLLLEGYGAYGDPLDPGFSQWAVSLLDRGVTLAWAHVRGGGEHGEAWHDAGRREHKRNSFSDFIACAEHLVREGFTSSDRLAITGASAGGLLVGAVLNQRPGLFRAALVEVPFVDVMHTMLDPTLPLTIGEYDEWGDPREPEAFRRMRAYSPYDNVAAQAYPALLVRAAYHDSQVLFHEPTKWVQRLRARKTDGNPVLLWMTMEPSGHQGRTSQGEAAADEARRQAWLLSQWGLAD